MRHSPPLKMSKSVGGVKYASPPSSERPIVVLMSPMPLLDRATHDAPLPLLDQGVMQRVTRLGTGPQASHEAIRLWLQAASASRALADGHSTLYHHTLELGEELSQECLKVEALEKEL
ncbi:hypothetical protein LIER_13829 [Lithospermum erythrorhizon]|uniref:Uncharacterized protein n=1 Tax=Lithospermum erythrorhizon TaxID=34254 RepID=A0AAV3Q1F6_LITER